MCGADKLNLILNHRMEPFYDFSCVRGTTWQKKLVQKDGRKWLLLINEFIWGDVILQSAQMCVGSRVGHVVDVAASAHT
jgi:hypothetical protein